MTEFTARTVRDLFVLAGLVALFWLVGFVAVKVL